MSNRHGLRHKAMPIVVTTLTVAGILLTQQARLRHVFSWAIEMGFIDDTPFKRGPQTVARN